MQKKFAVIVFSDLDKIKHLILFFNSLSITNFVEIKAT